MRKLSAFNNVSLDGYFTDATNEMTWVDSLEQTPDWASFLSDNVDSDVTLIFGRKTYDLMNSYWPTEQAKKDAPETAEAMTRLHKVVFSRTMDEATWDNTTVIKTDPVNAIREMKQQAGNDLLVMGSGTVIAPLAQAGLIDEYRVVVIPIVLGAGRTMFDGVGGKPLMKLEGERKFNNGAVLLTYSTAKVPAHA